MRSLELCPVALENYFIFFSKEKVAGVLTHSFTVRRCGRFFFMPLLGWWPICFPGGAPKSSKSRGIGRTSTAVPPPPFPLPAGRMEGQRAALAGTPGRAGAVPSHPHPIDKPHSPGGLWASVRKDYRWIATVMRHGGAPWSAKYTGEGQLKCAFDK